MKFFTTAVITIAALLTFSCADQKVSNSRVANPAAKPSQPVPLPSPMYEFQRADKPVIASKHLLHQFADLNSFKSGLHCSDKPCMFLRQRLLTRMGFYKSYILEGIKIARDMQIDILLNHHETLDSMQGDPTETRSVMDSKQMVISFNEQLNPDLLGAESCYGLHCDEDSEYEDSVRLAEDIGYPLLSKEKLHEIYLLMSKENWVTQYHELHQDANIVGIDDYELQSAEQLIGELLQEQGIPESMTLEVREPMVRLRSYVAIAKMAHLLKERGLKHGTITLGYYHGSDFKQIATDYGIPLRIYIAVPEWIRYSKTEDRFQPF